MTVQLWCRKTPLFARPCEAKRGVSVSSDTETPEREFENPHVEQRQSAGDDCWRSARHLGQVGSAIHEPILGALEF